MAAGMVITLVMVVGLRRRLSTMATPDAVFLEVESSSVKVIHLMSNEAKKLNV